MTNHLNIYKYLIAQKPSKDSEEFFPIAMTETFEDAKEIQNIIVKLFESNIIQGSIKIGDWICFEAQFDFSPTLTSNSIDLKVLREDWTTIAIMELFLPEENNKKSKEQINQENRKKLDDFLIDLSLSTIDKNIIN